MSTHSLCCIGYITQDKIVTPHNSVYMPGGTSFYFAHAIKHLNADGFLLVTALADSDMNVVEEIRKEGIDVKVLPSARSVCFENIYGENQNERIQRVTAKADPFTIEGLRDIDARIIHLGSLLADDFSLDIIKYLSGKALLSVDVQGFLRKVDNEQVLPIDWQEKREALKYIHILKANEAEMEVLTGCTEPYEAALLIADWGVKEVLLTLGDKGSLIYSKGQFHEIPAYPALQIVDATGCGDTYMVGYLYMRNQGASYREAGCYAAAMCTIKLQLHGPFCGTKETIKEVIGNL
ncbi:PfkB family carbohydrate kinase [Bacteroides helcogenes]|uniref:PfkB domain protein n=1 Tax=Bacteroides helcogenes (strain ATCC 35417 / DSM 20613 / JCM 6297 / CCUG 15421 / P 36-108) TaxID=693979 RepID=E6SP67_BACT6|nr:PfkB family carbohydrate kinase [Bacteroides helcogenes]ADV43837.1 PfkB domain protein [Bacteroides helcogenes P 36-108]MDY5237467.1 PfkB family carbohydrate kinase [Bacteroides helcogenes]